MLTQADKVKAARMVHRNAEAMPCVIMRAGLDDTDAMDNASVYPEWVPGKKYKAGDVVAFDGKLYESTHDENIYGSPDVQPYYWNECKEGSNDESMD